MLNAYSEFSPTTVLVHTPISKSHERRVQSHPTLYASLLSEGENKARDTRPVCDFSTETGAFRFAVSSAPFGISEFAILRRFLCGSTVENTGAGTSSSEGISVVHSPTSLSQLAVNRCVPLLFAVIEETAAECRCKDAKGIGEASAMDVIRAVVSYEALAMECV